MSYLQVNNFAVTLAGHAAAASSSCTHQVKYDVFINFGGEDSIDNITSHLLHATLVRTKIEAFIDYRLERGDKITPALVRTIRELKALGDPLLRELCNLFLVLG